MEPIRSHRAPGPPPRNGAGPAPLRHRGPPIYPPREDSWLLLPFANVPPGTRFLEVGTGSGVAALTAAHGRANVVATDLNPFALRELRARARGEGVHLEVVRTDLARGLGRFDRIVANPPYLPTRPEERDPDRWHNLALDGGPDGCRVTARLVGELDCHLTSGGEAFVLTSTRQDPDALARVRSGWVSRGGTVEVVASRALEGERLEVWRLRLA